MTATIKLSGAESSVENVQTYSDYEFDYALEMGYRQHASGVIAEGPLLTTGYYNYISDSTFEGESDLTSVGDLVSNCRFYDLNLNSNSTRVIGVYAGSGDLKIYGDDCVVLGYSTQTVVIDVGAARTRYGANQESTSLTDNSTTTIYLDNDKITPPAPPVAGDVSPLTTKGDVWGYSTLDARIPIGTDTHVLTADSTQALGVKWGVVGSGSGDMLAATYDPTTIEADVYDLANATGSLDGGTFA